ncbi:excinuclease ABC subunit C [Caulobacter henricii]|uniref:Excinuclease ABC subunit C n=1 Tax=Caulobacter henricii TaxID=69395 RepID=A0A0P0P411_9CAUL|nr:excinuclease ABC subunit C [Caulobacter henricii]
MSTYAANGRRHLHPSQSPLRTLYIGVTNDLSRRIWEHREGVGSQFCRKYGVHRLVYYEEHEDISFAIHREKRLKKYHRQWKINLIEGFNPTWTDLYETWNC